MKANELRIGNCLRYKDHHYLKQERRGKVFRVIPDDIVFLSDTGNVPYVEPIPLTPEILEKCGFDYVSEGLLYADKHHCIYEGGKEHGEVWKFQPFCTMDIDCTVSINYLHQLQNLIFVIAGEELEVKL